MNNQAEIEDTMIPWPVEKTAFKLKFRTKWRTIIPKLQTHINDKYGSRFQTAVVKLKMSRLTLLPRKYMIEFITKHDSSKDCMIQFDKTFSRKYNFGTGGNRVIFLVVIDFP